MKKIVEVEELANMDEPKPVNVEVPEVEDKPKRKRKSRENKEEVESKELEQNITLLLKTGFDMLAIRDPVWKVQDQEIETIAKPGTRIINRLGAAEGANKNVDYVILAVGLLMIVIPRVLIIRSRAEGRKEKSGIPKNPVHEGNRRNNETHPNNAADNVKQFLPGLA